MASNETNIGACIMCLDAPAVNQIETCQHSFCLACLDSYCNNDTNANACPACRVTGEETLGETGMDHNDEDPNAGPSAPNLLNCTICYYKGSVVRAVKSCVNCKDLPMCAVCVQAHLQNKVTKDHVTVLLSHYLPADRKEVDCEPHGIRVEMFCSSCSKYICFVCLSLEHADHEVEAITDSFSKNVVELRRLVKNGEGLVRILQADEKTTLRAKTEIENKEETLIKAIEDHTEKVIEEALADKETLKKEVRKHFSVRDGLAKMLDVITEMLKAYEEFFTLTDKALHEEAEPSSTYVERLRHLIEKLNELKTGPYSTYSIEMTTHRYAYDSLRRRDLIFYPRKPNMRIGGFQKPSPRCDAGGKCVCETCDKVQLPAPAPKVPNPSRVSECRDAGFCKCGTCSSAFDRSKVGKRGCCNNHVDGVLCRSKMASTYYK